MSLLRKIKNKIKKKYSNKLANPASHNDVYLVEFPKSGITWLLFLIGNTNLMLSKMNIKMTFYNQHQFIADIHQLRGNLINENIIPFPPYRFIKSHEKYNKRYNFVVYLMRNPFDVMVSYYRFVKYLGYNSDFVSFVKNEKYGIIAWVEHVNSWLEIQDDAQSFLLLKYEDLKKNSKNEIEKIYHNLGITVANEIYQQAIEYSKFDNMKESEEFYRSCNPRYKMVFVRKGKVHSKENIMDEESYNFIMRNAKNILEKYYPQYSEGW